MLRFLIVITIISLTFIKLYSQNADYESGDAAFFARNYDKAIAEYTKILQKDPKDAYALYKRGVAFLYTNNFDAAINDFNHALDINGDDPDSFNNRGLALSYKGDLEKAIEDFNRAIKLDVSFSQAYINRGSAFIAIQQFDKAVKDFDKAIKLDAKNPEIYLQRARLHYIKEDFASSAKDYSTAIALGLASAKVYYNRGNTYYKMEKYDEAIKDYTTAFELDPDELDALNNRAYTYSLIGKEAEADKDRKLLSELRNAIFTPLENLNFKQFASPDGSFSIELPDNWKLIQMPVESSDRVEFLLTPENINPQSEGMVVGVTAGIIKNLSKSIPVSTEPDILEFWKGSMDQSNEDMLIYKVYWQRHLQLKGHATILNRTTIQATENHMAFGMLEYVIAWGDNLIYLYFQAPETNFDYFEKIFEKSYNSLLIDDSLKLTY
ncbi:MAG: tetratricopeptide repeat protein [Candidatus Kapabacteria bacterium]|nr:tetratricopeptide repeat protein [Ignavibacteriota bacterium]MCW5883540.1 tetratricopeptide repeat protein [Candidatus Kapabacteria bacterium]